MSEANKRNPRRYWLGKKRDAETRRKIGLAQIGRTPWNKGRKLTDEEKKKVKNQYSKGNYVVSEETRRKLSDATKRTWQDSEIRNKRTHEPWNKGRKMK